MEICSWLMVSEWNLLLMHKKQTFRSQKFYSSWEQWNSSWIDCWMKLNLNHPMWPSTMTQTVKWKRIVESKVHCVGGWRVSSRKREDNVSRIPREDRSIGSWSPNWILFKKFHLTISLAFENPINKMVNIVEARLSQTQSLNFLLAIVTKAGKFCGGKKVRKGKERKSNHWCNYLESLHAMLQKLGVDS